MKIWIYNIFTILFFVLLSRLITAFLPFNFPSSILGLILLFIALNSGLLKQHYVEKACNLLNKYIGILFVPSGVALLSYFDLVQDNLLAILVASVCGTVVIFYTVGFTYSLCCKKGK